MKKKKLKRIICALLLIGFLLAQIPIFINIYMLEFSNRYILSVEEASANEFDCVLVLGAGVWGTSPTPMLEERLNKGIEVYKTGCTDKITPLPKDLCSTASPTLYSEFSFFGNCSFFCE